MRQMEVDWVHSIEAGGSFERPASFPDVLLYRGRADDGEECLVTFDRRNLLMSRQVAGLTCRIRLRICQFQAIAMLERDGRHIIRLVHSQRGLSVDLTEMANLAAAEEFCERLAEFLDLPSLTLSGRIAFETEVEDVQPIRRRNRVGRPHRPRFLARRQSANVLEFRRVAGREIIARS